MQELGLKEYEAKAFIALTQIPNGTARDVSEISDVPRTRVYDAVESLESKGLVEIQHVNPKQFRAVSIDEAVSTLRAEYEARTASLRATLEEIQPVERGSDGDVPAEVWSLAGRSAIATRATKLIEGAQSEVVVFVGDESGFTEPMAEAINDTGASGVTVSVGAVSEEIAAAIDERLPEVTVFSSRQQWMQPPETDRGPVIDRLLLVDGGAVLVSTAWGNRNGNARETAVFARGFDNSVVTFVRRLVSLGVVSVPDGSTEL